VFESFTGHLFVRQVNIFILNVYLTFNSWCVLFICIIYKSSVYKLVVYIHFSFKEHSAYSKSVWFSHCAPVAVSRKVISRDKSSSHRYNIWFVLKRALAVDTGFLNIVLMFYYDDVNEWRGIQCTYISYCITIVWNKTWRPIGHRGMVGRTWWAERLK
jgi:hypothetical protein